MRRWIAFSGLALALAVACWFSWRWWPSTKPAPVAPAALTASVETEGTKRDGLVKAEEMKPDEGVNRLIEQLREPSNKVLYIGTSIPGGEMLHFSAPMQDLIRLGERARPLLHQRLNDPEVQNEVVLVLGAVGDRTTVPLLIEAYPVGEARNRGPDHPQWMKAVCFTFALTYLTGQPIGRSRWGADCKPDNRGLWQRWWRESGATFAVPVVKPKATWVPCYPG